MSVFHARATFSIGYFISVVGAFPGSVINFIIVIGDVVLNAIGEFKTTLQTA
jgi:hypothetical protein